MTKTSYLPCSPLYICMFEYVIAFTSVPWNATDIIHCKSRTNGTKFIKIGQETLELKPKTKLHVAHGPV